LILVTHALAAAAAAADADADAASVLQLKPPGINKLINRVLDCEADATHWSLKDRLVLVNDVLDGFAAAGMLCKHVVFACWHRLLSSCSA
jgi:hypothetical protein